MRFLVLAAAALALPACLPIPTLDQIDGIITVIDIVTGAP